MRNQQRKFSFCLSLAATSLFFISFNAYAHTDYAKLENAYDDGYEDGYDDGYEDAMEDCDCPPILHQLRGFYIGAAGGYESFQVQRKVMDLDNQIGNFNTNVNGWTGKVFGGYGTTFRDRYYLGGEVFLGTSGATGKDHITLPGTMYNGTFSVGTSYGVSIRPGYQQPGWPLLYLSFGYNRAELTADDGINGTTSKSTDWTNGFSYGLGAETPVYKNFKVRLEYNHINYSSFNNNATAGSKNEPADNQGLLGVIYRLPF